MGHFIYRFHHQITQSLVKKKKKSLTIFLNRQVKQGCFKPVKGNKQIICLNSAHTQQKIFLMGSVQTAPQFPMHLSYIVNKQAAHAANTV